MAGIYSLIKYSCIYCSFLNISRVNCYFVITVIKSKPCYYILGGKSVDT